MWRMKGMAQQELFGPRGGLRVRAGRLRSQPQPQPRRSRRRKGEPVARKRRPGRPPKGARAGSPHKARPELKGRYPVHVVLRVSRDVGSLRKRFMYRAVREATITLALRELFDQPGRSFRIIHLSIQRDHIHLIVEAESKLALSRGMQSFQISAAKHINREYSQHLRLATRRRRSVFPDRFHQEIITTPKQARHTLAYVLNNWRKHREDRGSQPRTWTVDPFSSGAQFSGWKELANATTMWTVRETYQPLVVYAPRTWLLTVGWRRHGLVGAHDVPSTSTLVGAAAARKLAADLARLEPMVPLRA